MSSVAPTAHSVARDGDLYNPRAVGYALGLDLGTTFSGAAIVRDGRAEMVALSHNAAAIPSVLFLREDGTFLVGEAAARRGLQEPGRVAREFKRRFGDTTPLLLGGSPWSADALYSQLARHVVDLVAQQEGSRPAAVTVTHPANWGPYKIDLLRQALRSAGLDDAGLLTEPEAAAVHYASTERMEPGEVVAIYDLGGGTFDAAALRTRESGFELLGTAEGIERLGGIDFDEAVLAHVMSFAGPALEALDPADPAALGALARLRAECVAAKEGLSDDTEVSIPVILPTLQTQIRLTRAEFEDMIRPTLAETTAALGRTLRSGGVAPADVKAVLLVGGSSRIPLVGQLVAAEVGRPVAVDVHPKHAVALGAARAASGPVAAAAPRAPAAPAPEPAPPVVPGTVAPPADRPAPAARQPRARRVPVLAGVAVLVVIVALLALRSLGDDGPTQEVAHPDVPTFDLGDGIADIAAGAGALWVAGPNGLGRFDLASNQVTQAVRVGNTGDTRRVTFGNASVWVSDEEASNVSRVDPATNAVAAVIPLPGQPRDILFAAAAVWATLPGQGVVVRIDPETQAVTTILVRGRPEKLAFGAGTVWVTDPANATMARIDPVKNAVTGDAATGGCPDQVAADDASVWVQDQCQMTKVFRVEPASGKVVGSAAVAKEVGAMEVAGGSLWVADPTKHTVSQLDPTTLAVRRTVRVGLQPAAFALSGNTLWVVNRGDNSLSRIDG